MSTKPPSAAAVRVALTRLNWHHGRGDIVAVNAAAGTFTRRPHQCRPETRRFRVVGRTVHALGHQLTVQEVRS